MALNSLLSFGTGQLSQCFRRGLDRHGGRNAAGNQMESFLPVSRTHSTKRRNVINPAAFEDPHPEHLNQRVNGYYGPGYASVTSPS